ncbi:MAG: sigma-70 family RNA polymerase sigma factor [Sedimentisphaerales bacterium]|nr:sigma-70 family RNA polymerase sigma factor [Sedimentisphaerales bacterium]
MAESEILLLRRFAANGDAQAFAEIVKNHAPLVYGVCLRVLGNKETACDVVQETFFQLVRDAAKITDSLPSWLHRTATNRAIDIIRQDSQRKKREFNYTSSPESINAEDEKAAWNEISICIDEELENLDDQTKEVLILRFFEGQTMAEIAEKFNISQPTVSRRIDSGLELLRLKLKSRGIIVPAAVFMALLSDNIVKAAPASLMKELGKIAMAGSKASAGSKIGTGITAVKIKIIAIAVSVIVVGSAVVYYKQSASPSTDLQTRTDINDITIDKLTDICAALESTFQDITVEYEWAVEPTPATEDLKKDGIGGFITLNPEKMKWSSKHPFEERSLSESIAAYMDENEQTFKQTIMQSYNGKVAKYFSKGGLSIATGKQVDISSGTITERKDFMLPLSVTPLSFSILGLKYIDEEKIPFSERLRKKEFVHLVNSVERVNGFNAIYVELLWDAPNVPILHKKEPQFRIYFSVDHGYAPVKYEYLNYTGTMSEPKYTRTVNSFEKVADGLWFPSQGYIKMIEKNLNNTYKASKIVVNQGLTDEDFDIEFPPGTRITNEITDSNHVDNLTEK